MVQTDLRRPPGEPRPRQGGKSNATSRAELNPRALLRQGAAHNHYIANHKLVMCVTKHNDGGMVASVQGLVHWLWLEAPKRNQRCPYPLRTQQTLDRGIVDITIVPGMTAENWTENGGVRS